VQSKRRHACWRAASTLLTTSQPLKLEMRVCSWGWRRPGQHFCSSAVSSHSPDTREQRVLKVWGLKQSQAGSRRWEKREGQGRVGGCPHRWHLVAIPLMRKKATAGGDKRAGERRVLGGRSALLSR